MAVLRAAFAVQPRRISIEENLFTLTTDMFPSQAVGSAVGFGGMAGAIGGMLIAQIAGRVL
ncbi:MAG TPA: hypothetical protein VL242_53855, partial [Sorangium sp.]|nr:hypothetical protein [Sorangium sp.]